MSKGYKELVAEANECVATYSVTEALVYLSNPDVAFVDLREHPELEEHGILPGAVHVTRGMLEFRVDPESPYHDPVFSSGKRIVFYCASGGRSALAARTARTMGLEHVGHISGGIAAWKEAGGPIENTVR